MTSAVSSPHASAIPSSMSEAAIAAAPPPAVAVANDLKYCQLGLFVGLLKLH